MLAHLNLLSFDSLLFGAALAAFAAPKQRLACMSVALFDAGATIGGSALFANGVRVTEGMAMNVVAAAYGVAVIAIAAKPRLLERAAIVVVVLPLLLALDNLLDALAGQVASPLSAIAGGAVSGVYAIAGVTATAAVMLRRKTS